MASSELHIFTLVNKTVSVGNDQCFTSCAVSWLSSCGDFLARYKHHQC